ncbi:MAG: DUF2267 domain-containing protein [Armatimonadota bacterium]|nr:DUF2267 domain-containing protein [bacterium]
MNTGEFLTMVRERTNLRTDDEARSACESVFDALRLCVPRETSDQVAAELPRELKDVWEGSWLERAVESFVSPEEMNLDMFIFRVQDRAKLEDRKETEQVVRAIFLALHDQLNDDVEQKLVFQLPRDIREFWQSAVPTPTQQAMEGQVSEYAGAYPLPPHTGGEEPEAPSQPEEFVEGKYDSGAIGPAAAEVYRSDQQVRNEIEELLDASDEVDASTVNVEVKQGQVTLNGTVRSNTEREAAARVASDALGATVIQNDLQVSEPT